MMVGLSCTSRWSVGCHCPKLKVFFEERQIHTITLMLTVTVLKSLIHKNQIHRRIIGIMIIDSSECIQSHVHSLFTANHERVQFLRLQAQIIENKQTTRSEKWSELCSTIVYCDARVHSNHKFHKRSVFTFTKPNHATSGN